MSDVYGKSVVTDELPRCYRCNKPLAFLATRPWRIKCDRCKATTQAGVQPGEPVESADD